ncbi:hypothetical protein JCM10449v2_002739 [Rhodotorula kratochvilovae]
MSEEPPAKRSKNVSRACDLCRTSKRKCDGMQPCGNCQHGDKDCAYTMGDRRRGRTAAHARTFAPEASSSSSAPLLPTPPALAPPTFPPPPGIAGPSNNPFPHRSPAMPAHVLPSLEGGPSPRTAADDAMLASLTRAMANEPAPGGTPSDAHDAVTPGDVDHAEHSTGFLASIHRHLSAVFSLRAVPQGRPNDDLLEPDRSLGSFFLPSKEEGLAYVRCYFDHAASTYRFVDDEDVTALATRFFEQDPALLADPESTALLLAVMAVGCLWTPSWTAQDPNKMTPRAVKLYHAAQRQLAQVPPFPARLSLVRIHLASTHFLLGLSRFQTAYLSFSTAGRLALMLGLHRNDPSLPPPEREKRRRVFWSSFMMDRYISAVLGLPVLYDELDISQPYFAVPDNATLRADIAQQNRVLIGSLAHIKLSRVLGHAIRLLGSPKEVTPLERSSRIATLETELAQWSQESPAFFQPSPTGRDGLDEPFAQVPHIFERQRRRCHAAYHFIKLLAYRSYVLDELLSRLRGSSTPASGAPSVEVQTCVHAAVQIAETAIVMQDQSSYSGMFWSTAYMTFASLTVLFVYLILYLDAPDRAQVESVISRAMKANTRLAGARGEQDAIFRESRRIASILKPPPSRPAASSLHSAAGPSSSSAAAPQLVSPSGEPSNDSEGAYGLPFFLSSELAALGDDPLGASTANDWEALLSDLQGMVHAGFDVTSEGAFAAGASGMGALALPALDAFGGGEGGGAGFDWGAGGEGL